MPISERRVSASSSTRRDRDVDQDERWPGLGVEERRRRQRRVKRHSHSSARRRFKRAKINRRLTVEELGSFAGNRKQSKLGSVWLRLSGLLNKS